MGGGVYDKMTLCPVQCALHMIYAGVSNLGLTDKGRILRNGHIDSGSQIDGGNLGDGEDLQGKSTGKEKGTKQNCGGH